MTRATNAHIQAQQLLSNCGLDEITDLGMDLFVAGLDAILIEEELTNCDGKIIFGKNKAVIKVNSKIQFPERKRFVTAHEIGHLIMHRNMQLPDDTFSNFNIIAGMEKALKFGKQELEANEFAGELLIPEKLFLKEAKGKKFSPLLIKQLAERFKASLTATVFRYLQFDLHPICLVFIDNGIVKYWKKSDDLKVWLGDYTRLTPPADSVAAEYIKKNYEFLYKLEEKVQTISKSTWFTLNEYDNEDTDFYEYCIPTKRYKTILSIIWED
ncbi:MAG: ImmA/IrrE family metallo-endopeptidase [Bacteroidales bacterium]|nr:ImmA/IrrE family metallo-endopeptidase [Bacteroidales bacterium]